jgi:hypothetical protein
LKKNVPCKKCYNGKNNGKWSSGSSCSDWSSSIIMF